MAWTFEILVHALKLGLTEIAVVNPCPGVFQLILIILQSCELLSELRFAPNDHTVVFPRRHF